MNPSKGEDGSNPDQESRLDLSATQVLAAAGAATLGAVLATLFGVYGTIIGTAVLSLVTSVGSVLLVHFTQKTKEKIKAPLARSLPGVAKSDHPTKALNPNWDGNAGAYRSTQVNTFRDPDATQPLSTVKENSVPTGTATAVDPHATSSDSSESVSTTLVDMEPVDAPANGSKRKKLWISIAISTVLVFIITIGALSIMALVQDKDPSYYFGPSPAPTGDRIIPSPEEEPEQHQPPPEDDPEDEWDEDIEEEPSDDGDSEPESPPDEEPDDPEDDPTDPEDHTEDEDEDDEALEDESDSNRA